MTRCAGTALQLCSMVFLIFCFAQAQSPLPTLPAVFTPDSKLSCAENSTESLPGGYRALDPDDSTVEAIGMTAFNEWFQRTADQDITACTPDNYLFAKNYVVEACAQVVAGMNYALVMQSYLSCLYDNGTYVVLDNVTLDGIVYQPLGQAPPQVTYVEISDLSEEFFEYAK